MGPTLPWDASRRDSFRSAGKEVRAVHIPHDLPRGRKDDDPDGVVEVIAGAGEAEPDRVGHGADGRRGPGEESPGRRRERPHDRLQPDFPCPPRIGGCLPVVDADGDDVEVLPRLGRQVLQHARDTGEEKIADVGTAVVDKGENGRCMNELPQRDGGAVLSDELRVQGDGSPELFVDPDLSRRGGASTLRVQGERGPAEQRGDDQKDDGHFLFIALNICISCVWHKGGCLPREAA